MPIGQAPALAVLDAIFNAGSYVGPAVVHARMWTVAPTPAGTGGTECTGTMVRPTVSTGTAVPGTAGRVAQVVSDQPLTFEGVAQPSSAVVAMSFHDSADGSLLWVGPFTPPATKAAGGWDAGDSPSIPASQITAAFTA